MVSANVAGRDPKSVVEEIQNIINTKIKLPEGYHYEKYSNLKITLQEYQNVFATLNNTTLLNKALALGEITTIQYFMEINYYSHGLSNYLQTEKDYHTTIAELYKYQL